MPKAIIIYETRKGATQLIAEAIEEGLNESGMEVTSKRIYEVELEELKDFSVVILGSPTYTKDMMQTMKTFLFKLEQQPLKDKVGASFGAYGWSGEAVEMISDTMNHIFGMRMVLPAAKLPGSVSGVGREQYQEFGRMIGAKVKNQD